MCSGDLFKNIFFDPTWIERDNGGGLLKGNVRAKRNAKLVIAVLM